MRQGSSAILRCIAEGCKIYPDPLNRIPDDWSEYILSKGLHDKGVQNEVEEVGEAVAKEVDARPKRGRPKKVKP